MIPIHCRYNDKIWMITFICLIIIALFYLQLFGLHPDHWQSCLPGYCKLQLPEQRTGIKKDFILWGIADTIEQQDLHLPWCKSTTYFDGYSWHLFVAKLLTLFQKAKTNQRETGVDHKLPDCKCLASDFRSMSASVQCWKLDINHYTTYPAGCILNILKVHHEIHWQLQFTTFAKVVHWKKHPCQFHWLRLFRMEVHLLPT